MQLGILATASHALSTGSMFSVYYRPRTSPSEFLIPYEQYMNSIRCSFAVGTRFKMRIDCEEAPEERPSGTLAGIEEDDPVHWPCSQWKCLVLPLTCDRFNPAQRDLEPVEHHQMNHSH
ncbi:hypothetical protein MKW98_023367 [Papaver atlanticum]|uniref:Auxin response factor domain-containing protein n=1 Tax=Papaver atlanticum TaxID=357466 RepID=A0AAD4SYW9_9MAGN|nr:hypothetical protein MKW98_023367 [Papaver atlanticum]